MNEIKKFISEIYSLGELPSTINLGEFQEIGRCFNSLSTENMTNTLNKKVADFFRSNNFKVSSIGNSYLIALV